MSFRWITMVRRGSWQAFRKFALEEHQDFDRRTNEIDRQVALIGKISVFYKTDTETQEVTQIREAIYVEEGTSIHKLCMAYVAHGGNILDISMFLDPSLTYQRGEELKHQHPLGGVISPLSGSAGETTFSGNWVGLDKHYYWKVGKAEIPAPVLRKTGSRIQRVRLSIEKEIQAKRNRIEEKIIKLCDLREQLLKEKAYIEMVRGRSPEIEFSNQYNIAAMDRILWNNAKDIPINSDPESPRLYDITDINREDFEDDEGVALRTYFINVFEDAESEVYPYTAL